jgi:uncharacterized GH25 family protein
MKKNIIITALAIVFFAVPANAHFMWINVGDYTLDEGKTVMLNVGWGHSFGNPVGNVLQDFERMDELFVLDPDGKKMTVASANKTDFRTDKPLKKEGTYLAVLNRKEGFSSKTTEGYKSQSKKELKNVIKCSYSGGYGKAIINLGKGDGSVLSKEMGHTLEIIPLNDPGDIDAGDYMRIKVLYKGEPLSTDISATFVGFSTEGEWAYTAKTDKDGKGKIKIFKPGVWLVKIGHAEPYPDQEACDRYSYTSVLTFEVK